MNKYLDHLMKNYPLESEDSDAAPNTHTLYNKHRSQKGGAKKNSDIPTGGFPPIFLCEALEESDEDISKSREYSTHKTAVSIKEIMKKRRDATPFVSI